MAMMTLHLDPFWRTSIGFDRLFDMMDESLRFEPQDNYPPCNIVRTGEDTYRITLAVAGFKPDQVNVTVNQNVLTISGQVNQKHDQAEYMYHGIAARPFERRFSLADFVEVKNAQMGNDSKANHLAYVGDASVGERVNIGAGTIIANYDGANKNHTTIENDVHTGSNSVLVAPITVGAGATIAAGSTVVKEVPAAKLTVARAKQVTIENWQRPVKTKK